VSRAGQLWPHLIRSVRWQPVVAAAALAGAVGRVEASVDGTTLALLVALGTAFVLDDPAAVTLASSPSTLSWRRGVRLAFVLSLLALLWLVVVIVAEQPVATAWNAVALQLAVMVAIVLAVSGAAVRRSSDGSGGTAAGPALLGFVVIARVLPGRWAFFPVQVHERVWVATLVAAVVVLLVSSRDPAARPVNRFVAVLRQSR
jgi:hypothetical protein